MCYNTFKVHINNIGGTSMSNQRVAYARLSEDDNCNFESMSIANQRKIILQYNFLLPITNYPETN